ncbi:MAG: hypothetical protein U0074_08475 [Kouleothrix sp.]
MNVGNAQTYAATNEPAATDSALRQRFHHREQIGGPEDWDDYAALIGVKLARQIKQGPGAGSGRAAHAASRRAHWLAPVTAAAASRFSMNPFAGKKALVARAR